MYSFEIGPVKGPASFNIRTYLNDFETFDQAPRSFFVLSTQVVKHQTHGCSTNSSWYSWPSALFTLPSVSVFVRLSQGGGRNTSLL